MDALLERLREHWLAQDVHVSGGASEEEVAAFEREHDVSLPPLFREYVRELNGMAGDSRDRNSIAFWPISRIRRVDQLYNRPTYRTELVFAYHLTAPHDYSIYLSPGSICPDIIAVLSQRQVASAFEEFLRRYLEGDQDLLYPEVQVLESGNGARQES